MEDKITGSLNDVLSESKTVAKSILWVVEEMQVREFDRISDDPKSDFKLFGFGI
jgi:hypothetical protein